MEWPKLGMCLVRSSVHRVCIPNSSSMRVSFSLSLSFNWKMNASTRPWMWNRECVSWAP